jgi:hypothetical protein
MIKYLLVILISTLFLVALTHFIPSSSLKTEIHAAEVRPNPILNPIDCIHGDKWLENNTIRTNNFDSILAIPALHLKSPSELYLIQPLPNQYFLLTRKKFFHQNRRYSLIVKVEDNRIIQLKSFVDFDIRKLVVHNNKYYVLQGDYSELDNHWGYVSLN